MKTENGISSVDFPSPTIVGPRQKVKPDERKFNFNRIPKGTLEYCLSHLCQREDATALVEEIDSCIYVRLRQLSTQLFQDIVELFDSLDHEFTTCSLNVTNHWHTNQTSWHATSQETKELHQAFRKCLTGSGECKCAIRPGHIHFEANGIVGSVAMTIQLEYVVGFAHPTESLSLKANPKNNLFQTLLRLFQRPR